MSRFSPRDPLDWRSVVEQAQESSTDTAPITSQLAGVAMIGVGAVLLSALAIWFVANSSFGRELGGPKNLFTWVKLDTRAEQFGGSSYTQRFQGQEYVTSPRFEMNEEMQRAFADRQAGFDSARRIGESYRMPPPRRP